MEARFIGQVALVTGAAKGVGLAVARGLVQEGAAVVLADRNRSHAETAAEDLSQLGGPCMGVEMDLGCHAHIEPAVQAAANRFGRIDILVNCAATMGRLRPFVEQTAQDWEDVLRVNLMGTVLLTQAATREMLAGGRGGAVVNILAIQAQMPLPQHGPYAASKGALTSFTKYLAVELASQGIRVNGVAVGPVWTESTENALGLYGDSGAAVADAQAATLVGRMGRAEDIAKVAIFLASRDAAYLAGAILPADGGRMLSRKADPFMLALNKNTQ